MTQMSSELEDVHLSASQASEIMEGEQLERRELEEKVAEIQSHESELIRENEQLQLQIAEMSILARIKQEDGGSESSDGKGERREGRRVEANLFKTPYYSPWFSVVS